MKWARLTRRSCELKSYVSQKKIKVSEVSFWYVYDSVETKRNIFEFEQIEQGRFQAKRVSHKIYALQFLSQASLSKKVSRAQEFQAKPEWAQANFQAQILCIYGQI